MVIDADAVTIETASAEQPISTSKPFIQANTVEVTLDEMRNNHIIPVFIKDNEPLISHTDFIQITSKVAADVFHGEQILKPVVRVSHPIKGRIPEAKNKPANELHEWEKTIYYERMAFIIEVPSIFSEANGDHLSLTIGGVKAYNLDNLYGKKGMDEHFKMFIGFQNKVCTNLSVFSDGYIGDARVSNLGQLMAYIRILLEGFNANLFLDCLKSFCEYSLTESQFAHLIGRCKMYQFMNADSRKEIPALSFGDNQINTVCRDYYKDNSFCKGDNGEINLWKLYNLFTGANKATYIDSFLEKSVNAFEFVEQLSWGVQKKTYNWFLEG